MNILTIIGILLWLIGSGYIFYKIITKKDSFVKTIYNIFGSLLFPVLGLVLLIADMYESLKKS